MFLLNSIKLEWVNKILVSSAKIIGAEVLFLILGKSFMYKRKNRTLWDLMSYFSPIWNFITIIVAIIYCCSTILDSRSPLHLGVIIDNWILFFVEKLINLEVGINRNVSTDPQHPNMNLFRYAEYTRARLHQYTTRTPQEETSVNNEPRIPYYTHNCNVQSKLCTDPLLLAGNRKVSFRWNMFRFSMVHSITKLNIPSNTVVSIQ